MKVEKRRPNPAEVFSNKKRKSTESTGTNGPIVMYTNESANRTTRMPEGYSLRDVNNVQEFIHDPSAVDTVTAGGDTEHIPHTAHSSVAGIGRSYNNL